MTIAHPARPSAVLDSIDLISPARIAGWRHAQAFQPGEMLCGVAQLQLAGQFVIVHQVVNSGEDVVPLLDRLQDEITASFFIEHYIVMNGFSVDVVTAAQRQFSEVVSRRVSVGGLQDYLSWLPARLGPLGSLSLESPLRRLAEHMLCVSSYPEPTAKRRAEGSYAGSAIKPSFDLGQLGVQAVETLLAHTRGDAAVVNVESVPAWQSKDVDLLVLESGLGGRQIQVEIKNEDKTTGNIVLEKYSCFERRTPGWLEYSSAEVLVSCLWPTGDVILMDFAQVRQWVSQNKETLRLVKGTVPEQWYHSQVYLAPIKGLLKEVPGVVHLRVQDWLPTLYTETFKKPTLVPRSLEHKTLRPHRLPALV